VWHSQKHENWLNSYCMTCLLAWYSIGHFREGLSNQLLESDLLVILPNCANNHFYPYSVLSSVTALFPWTKQRRFWYIFNQQNIRNTHLISQLHNQDVHHLLTLSAARHDFTDTIKYTSCSHYFIHINKQVLKWLPLDYRKRYWRPKNAKKN